MLTCAAIGRMQFLYESIRCLAKEGYHILLVITASAASEYTRLEDDFKRLADDIGAEFFLTDSIDDQAILDKLQGVDVGISVNWPQIMQHKHISAFRLGILNAHMGDLPRYRGNACPNWAIINGEKEIALSIHLMEAGKLDCGRIITQDRLALDDNTYIGDVYRWAEGVTPRLFKEALALLEKDSVYTLRYADPESPDAMQCPPRKPSDSEVDWSCSLKEIHRLIRASSKPFAGAYSFAQGKKLTIWRAEMVNRAPNEEVMPGTVCDVTADYFIVATADGMLTVTNWEYNGDLRKGMVLEEDKIAARIFHGVTNICGIAGSCAEYQRAHGFISQAVVFKPNPFYSNHDVNLALNTCFKQYVICAPFVVFFRVLRNFFTCLKQYDLFNFYYLSSLLPMNLDLPILKLFGKKIVVITTGSDVRLQSIVGKQNEFYRFMEFGVHRAFFDVIKKLRLHWQNIWVDRFIAIRMHADHVSSVLGFKKVVSNIWVNNMLDIDAYQPSYAAHNPVVLVHAPSHKDTKGTAFVAQAVENLKKKGLKFEYKQLEHCSVDNARRIYRDEADIIIDQFFLGDFGTFAVEGMCFGKPVCAYVIEEVKRKHFPDCPIVNCTIHTLEAKLEELIANPDLRRRLGEAGRAFAEKYCNEKIVNEKLIELYKEIL